MNLYIYFVISHIYIHSILSITSLTSDIIADTPNINNGECNSKECGSYISDHHLIKFMEETNNDYLVIDVRDPAMDYPGGHIVNSINIYHKDFIKNIPILIKKYNDKTNIIFHCMHSQSRGPMCSRWYCSAIECLLKSYKNQQQFEQCIDEDEDFQILKSIHLDENTYLNLLNQNVFILKGGFREWVNKYKNNKQYVEDFKMKYWEYATIGDKKELFHKNEW